MHKPFNSPPFLSMLLSAALIAGSMLSAGVLAHSGAKGIVKERMDIMQNIGKGMKKVGAMVKGKEPFEPETIGSQAKAISEASPGIPDLFPEGSLPMVSEALPAIWEEWDQFSSLVVKMEEEASKLQEAAETGDRRTITMQFAKLGKVCSGCHTDYRKKKEEEEK